MLWFTESKSNDRIAINPDYVVAVFTAKEGEFSGKTVISLISGQTVVEENAVEVVGCLQANK